VNMSDTNAPDWGVAPLQPKFQVVLDHINDIKMVTGAVTGAGAFGTGRTIDAALDVALRHFREAFGTGLVGAVRIYDYDRTREAFCRWKLVISWTNKVPRRATPALRADVLYKVACLPRHSTESEPTRKIKTGAENS